MSLCWVSFAHNAGLNEGQKADRIIFTTAAICASVAIQPNPWSSLGWSEPGGVAGGPANAGIEELRAYVRSLDADQIPGVVNSVKGIAHDGLLLR